MTITLKTTVEPHDHCPVNTPVKTRVNTNVFAVCASASGFALAVIIAEPLREARLLKPKNPWGKPAAPAGKPANDAAAAPAIQRRKVG